MLVPSKNPRAIPEIGVLDHFVITKTTRNGVYGNDGATVQVGQNGLRKLQSKLGDICYLFSGGLVGILPAEDIDNIRLLKENARYVKAHVDARQRAIDSKFWIRVIQLEADYCWIPAYPYKVLTKL